MRQTEVFMHKNITVSNGLMRMVAFGINNDEFYFIIYYYAIKLHICQSSLVGLLRIFLVELRRALLCSRASLRAFGILVGTRFLATCRALRTIAARLLSAFFLF